MMIKTDTGQIILNTAEIAGMVLADNTIAKVAHDFKSAKEYQAKIYESVGLDPSKSYNVNRETGEVMEKI